MVAESLISEFVRTQNRHLIQALGEISELQMYKKGEGYTNRVSNTAVFISF